MLYHQIINYGMHSHTCTCNRRSRQIFFSPFVPRSGFSCGSKRIIYIPCIHCICISISKTKTTTNLRNTNDAHTQHSCPKIRNQKIQNLSPLPLLRVYLMCFACFVVVVVIVVLSLLLVVVVVVFDKCQLQGDLIRFLS